jgi:glycosyltransferase involved in cell wall biosynthesis
MKVLHVIPSMSRVHGGPTQALAMMERALTAHGVTVETATTDDDGPGRRNGKAGGRPAFENGVPRRYFSKRVDFYKVAPGFARWIAHEARSYDLLHIHALFSFTSTVAARAARRFGVPYVVRPLGTLDAWGMAQRRPALKALSMRWIEGPMLRHAAAVHFTSDEEAAQAGALGIPLRAAVIPLGVETRATPSVTGAKLARANGHCALYLSRLDPKKNLEGLLDAMGMLALDLPQLQLLIAGNGAPDYVAGLKARAQRLGLADRIRWLGHVEGADKAEAFAAADVFVLPSFSENFGIAAAEALAAGLPCLLGQGVAVAKEVVGAQAGLATRPDAPSIAEGLRRIIASDSALQAMSANARRLAAEQFSTQAMGARLKRLYLDILNAPHGFSAAR